MILTRSLFLVPECPFAIIVANGKAGSLFCLNEVFVGFHVSPHKAFAHVIAHAPHPLGSERVIGALCAANHHLILIEEGICGRGGRPHQRMNIILVGGHQRRRSSLHTVLLQPLCEAGFGPTVSIFLRSEDGSLLSPICSDNIEHNVNGMCYIPGDTENDIIHTELIDGDLEIC